MLSRLEVAVNLGGVVGIARFQSGISNMSYAYFHMTKVRIDWLTDSAETGKALRDKCVGALRDKELW